MSVVASSRTWRWLAVSAALAAAAPVAAQPPVVPPASPAALASSGVVRGRVFLSGDRAAPIAGATVTIVDASGGARALVADERGEVTVELAPGTYRVRAAVEGLGVAAATIVVTAGAQVPLDLDLQPTGEVIAVEGLGSAERHRRSAEAVNVIETENEQRQTADLGEVLARSTGVGVRRSGGLGSSVRFTLNGLGDDQVRFFLDGVPLELAGYPFGLENVPINLVERIDVYRGVVPVRFGADALGGAIDLVPESQPPGVHGSASYQAGSFGTQQLTVGAGHDDLPAGLFVRAGGFVDHSDNDYLVGVEVPDAVGRLRPASVHRFHDGYDAAGANLEVGVDDAAWADRFAVRGFVTRSAKELQHNLVMSVPYGEAETAGRGLGGAVSHRRAHGRGVSSDVVIGYAATRGRLDDAATCIYEWFGQCVRERANAGELGLGAIDSRWWSHDLYARLGAEWQVRPEHRARLSLSPTGTRRTGWSRRATDEPIEHGDDELLASLVAGAEYTYADADERVEVTGFAKAYLRRFEIDYDDPAEPTGQRSSRHGGVGAGARVRLAAWLYGKASYERAVRLPTAYEVLGDGATTLSSHDLRPERSHNANLGLTAYGDTRAGRLEADLNGFVRDARDLILLVGDDRVFQHLNVHGARSFGAEAATTWTAPGEHVALLGNCTAMSLRNSSSDGLFGEFEGDRIPNQPYLFFNLGARVQARGVAAASDELALTWTSRYVHEFYRGWESIGDPRYKYSVDAQLIHSLGLTYLVSGERSVLSFAIEGQNVTDARAFDFYGQERPGRAVYAKTTARF